MAFYSSTSSARIWRYHVFASFHRPDVRQSFLSHFRTQFSYNGITVFDIQGIKGSHSLGPALIQGIRESRISIVVFSKNYASSSWCLNELVEIFKCREDLGQLVIPIFYGVDQSDVRKQTGEFGEVFNETCARTTKEERGRWSQALTQVGNIAAGGEEDFLKGGSETDMIDKIVKDISNKLNVTPNRDFADMVGIEAHLHKIESLLKLESKDGAMIVGISGPAGIGKATIARALHSRLSNRFQLTCFMENLKGSSNSGGLDDYGLKLRLQEQLLSKILNQNGIMIFNLGAIRERLCNLKVLIILDDVDDLKQLEALANETAWFGPGSRIIVTTKDQELLRQHGIDNTYHVDFPSSEEALEILCRYAFRQSFAPDGFKELAKTVTKLCGNLPSDLRVVGSSLRGKKEEEWEQVMRRLEYESSSFNKCGKGKSRYSTGMTFLLVINLLLEMASAVADQLSFIRKPYFARISLVMPVLSVFLSILDLTYKIRAHNARFRCKWPIPWFYYPPRRYNIIFGSFTETVLLFCVVGYLVVSGINYNRIQKQQDGPIKVSVWPLFFAIGMVISKFMEKAANSDDILPITKMY